MTTAHATATLTLPTAAEYRAANDRLAAGYDEVERLIVRVDQFTRRTDPASDHGPDYPHVDTDEPVTHADVGALWIFIDLVRHDVRQLEEHLPRLRDALELLGERAQPLV